MNSDLVSVIVPVFNRLIFLGETIESVLRQSHNELELIIVDDGSTEDIQGFVSQNDDRRIRYLRQKNMGNAAARNAGIDVAKGEYLACLDSDDVWHPDFVESCLDQFALDTDVDVVYCQFNLIDHLGVRLPKAPSPKPLSGSLLEPLLMGHPVVPSSAMFRKSCVTKWGDYNPELDDWEMWLRWSVHGCLFTCLDGPLLNYRVHDQNLNLDWDQRRRVHMETLNQIYINETLPGSVLELRQRAYSFQHLYFAVLAWRLGRYEDSKREYCQAVSDNPSTLTNVEDFMEIACAHQNRFAAGSPIGLDLTAAQSSIETVLEALWKSDEGRQLLNTHFSQSYAWAYYSLARLAYTVANNMEQTRRFLSQSIKSWPLIILRSNWLVLLGLSIVGFQRIQAVKSHIFAKS